MPVVLGIGLFVVIFTAFPAYWIGQASIAEDCKKMGAFRVERTTFTCAVKTGG